MSLSSTTNRNDYLGNGSVDTYSYTFKVFSEDHIVVTVRDTSDVETTLTKTTHYTVSGVGESSGGSVALVNGAFDWIDAEGDLKTGYRLTIRRVVPLTQTTDIRNAGTFYAKTHEDQFDKQTMISQQQQEQIDRSVKLPTTVASSSFDPTLPSDIQDAADKVPIVNSTGDGFADASAWPSAGDISNAQTYANNAAASATAADASADAALVSESTAEEWATKTDGIVEATDYSSKAWAVGGTGVTDTASRGAAKEWATKTGGTVDGNEYSAKKYAQDAAAALASAFFRDVVLITSASSPYTVTQSDNGKLLEINSSGGAITINLPTIAGLSLPFNVAFKLTTAGNTVTINRGGTDTINGVTTATLVAAGTGLQLAADTDGSPDNWSSLDFGSIADGAVNKAKLDSTTTSSSLEVSNLSIACSVASNALTISLKDKSGSDPSAASPVTIGFRNSTSGDGTYVTRQVTSALSLVISSGSTLGHKNGLAQYIYVYAIDSGSGVVLGVSSVPFDEGSIQSATAEGGAGAADSVRLIYATASQSSKSIRLIGRLLSTQTTAGTWTAVPSEISVLPFEIPPISLHYYGSTTSVTNATDTVVIHTTKDHDPYNLYDTSTGEVLIPLTGKYLVGHAYGFSGSWASATNGLQIAIAINGAGENIVANSMAFTTSSGNRVVTKSAPIQLTAGDLIRQVVNQGSGSTTSGNSQQPMISVVYLGR